jgi:acyl-CoA synthetase (AMP-forming)/AMP-acid ligase II
MTARHVHLGDIIEVLADAVGDKPAVVTGESERTYAELDDRSTRLANHLADAGVRPGEHVAIHAMNCVEWVESFYACVKLRAVPINVNYRYVEAELRYLYDNADCVAVVVAPEFVDAVESATDALTAMRHRLVIGDEYERAITAASSDRGFGERSPDDLYMIYTGGTTGMPKGVMWRQEDIVRGAMNAGRLGAPIDTVEQLGAEAAAAPGQGRLMALGPMMHGGGQWVMGNAHVAGGVFVLYTERRFDPHTVLELAARAGVHSLSTIGDAMARPIAEALLDPACPPYDLSNLFSIGNGGAPLSAGVRDQLRRALPNVMILDSYGASETGAAGSRADQGEGFSSPRFNTGADVTVLSDDGRVCAVGEVGKLARSGNIPLGYYKDPDKTAATFPVVDGTRWVVPGDFARIEDDGSVTVLGRGSVSINSGGEKIHPEEVEAALVQHPAVFDAVVVGTPSERWGQQVTALVQVRAGTDVSFDELRAHCRTLVADYKVPKTVLFVDAVPRTPVGKVDYKRSVDEAMRRLDVPA